MVQQKTKEGDVSDVLYKSFHRILRSIEEEPFTEARLWEVLSDLESHEIIDYSPKTDLYDSIFSSIDLIDAGYHGFSDKKANNCLIFLHILKTNIHKMSPKILLFVKTLVSDMRRNMLK